jgi:hypothetical protein
MREQNLAPAFRRPSGVEPFGGGRNRLLWLRRVCPSTTLDESANRVAIFRMISKEKKFHRELLFDQLIPILEYSILYTIYKE